MKSSIVGDNLERYSTRELWTDADDNFDRGSNNNERFERERSDLRVEASRRVVAFFTFRSAKTSLSD